MKHDKAGAVFFTLCLLCLATAGFALEQADNAPVTWGNYRKIHSKVLGEDRTLLVSLPIQYDTPGMKFPVIFKLDGDKGNFLHMFSAAYYLLQGSDETPDPIIVGIVNTDRNRDMGPDQKADNFIRFIEAELIPFIDTNYRTNGFRILCGQSQSSIFALYSFLKQPMLFDAYILASFGFYKEGWSQLFESELKKNQDLKKVGKKYLFVANGKHDSYDPDGSIGKRGERFLELLKQTVPASVLMKSKWYEDEGHVPFPALYEGLKWVYACELAAAAPPK
jgi:uncharacterized protein